MKCLILANGDYGELDLYKKMLANFDLTLCADGGANYAYSLGIVPDYVVGDMDSIDEEVRSYYLEKSVIFKKFPRQKDFTDTQLVLSVAEELGVSDITFFGSMGSRIDHTLSNLYSCINLAENNKKISHYNPRCTVYVVADKLDLMGNIGEIISVLALTDMVTGLSEKGVEYPLDNVILEKTNPYAISNALAQEKAQITLTSGVIAVIHYHEP